MQILEDMMLNDVILNDVILNDVMHDVKRCNFCSMLKSRLIALSRQFVFMQKSENWEERITFVSECFTSSLN